MSGAIDRDAAIAAVREDIVGQVGHAITVQALRDLPAVAAPVAVSSSTPLVELLTPAQMCYMMAEAGCLVSGSVAANLLSLLRGRVAEPPADHAPITGTCVSIGRDMDGETRMAVAMDDETAQRAARAGFMYERVTVRREDKAT